MPPAAAATLKSLSTEILSQILAHLSHADLHHLRRSCRRLNEVIAPIVFEDLIVVPYSRNFSEILERDAQEGVNHHELRHVQHLIYQCAALPSTRRTGRAPDNDNEGKAEWFQKTYGQTVMQVLEEINTDYMYPGVADADAPDAKYHGDAGSEAEFLSLCRLVRALPKLRKITVVQNGAKTLAKPDYYKVAGFFGRCLFLSGHTCQSRSVGQDLMAHVSFDRPEVISYRVSSIVRALSSTSKHIESLSILGVAGGSLFYPKLLTGPEARSPAETFVRAFQRLSRLQILFDASPHGYPVFREPYVRESKLNLGLQQCHQLADLELVFDASPEMIHGNRRHMNLLRVILSNSLHLPSLQRLQLSYVVAQAEQLLAFLKRQAPTLRCLSVSNLTLKPSSDEIFPGQPACSSKTNDCLACFFRVLRTDLKLEEVCFTGQLEGGITQEIFLDSSGEDDAKGDVKSRLEAYVLRHDQHTRLPVELRAFCPRGE